LVLDLALNKPMSALCCSREFPISTEELLFIGANVKKSLSLSKFKKY
jgi:hypothetical protein